MDIAGIFATAQAVREGKLREQAQQAQLSALYASQQRKAQFQQAIQSGDMQAASQIDPEAALDFQGKLIAQQQGAQSLGADRRKATNEFAMSAANALRDNPQSAALVARIRDARVAKGEIDDFEIPGWDMAPGLDGPPGGEPTAQQAATVAAIAGEKRDAERQPAEFSLYQLTQDNPGFATWLDRKQRADKGKDPIELATAYRKEFTTLQPVKDYQQTVGHYRTLQSSGNTGPGGIAMLFSYIKMLDPTSTVNTGEQELVSNSGAIDQRLRGLFNSMLRGESSMDETLAKHYRAEAAKIMEARRAQARAAAVTYRGLATGAGVAPDDVVGPDMWADILGSNADTLDKIRKEATKQGGAQ